MERWGFARLARMTGNVAAVVGVGPGLGAALARRFAREGFAVGLMARRSEALAPVGKEIAAAGGRSVALACDATDAASVRAAFERLASELGHPSVLLYNAGAFQMGGILELSDEDFDRCWRANCAGGFYAAKCVLPAMIQRKAGTVVFTGATAALRGSARFAALAVGKFGLRALAQSMARELGPQGIHVAHVIIDGQIDTPRVRQMMPNREAHTLLAPDAIAEAYWQLHTQNPTTWTHELDLRPAVERF
jgi:NAD(P)-dependent dehydrogenase (short-subunit alcohol dehydrogenase family)